jgi:hypothetical protein
MTSTRSVQVNRKRSYRKVSSENGGGVKGDDGDDDEDGEVGMYSVALGDVLSDDEEDYGTDEDGDDDDEDSDWSDG